MPEGDTLFRAATTLRKALEGARVRLFRSPLPHVAAEVRRHGVLDGQRIDRVAARGKNLLFHFEDGRVLRSHMRMSGSWHLYREGEPWQRPAWQARAEIHGDNGFVAVCFNAPVVELLTAAQLGQSEVARLGPDATTDAFDPKEALRRVQSRGELTVGEVLLDQRALAGVGNVIKSEVLFLCSQDPFARVETVAKGQLEKLIAESHRLLVRNRVKGPRTTRESLDGGRLWVYGRSGKPCRRCATLIRMRRQGTLGRSTYFCPECQGAGEGPKRPLPRRAQKA